MYFLNRKMFEVLIEHLMLQEKMRILSIQAKNEPYAEPIETFQCFGDYRDSCTAL